MRNYFVFILLFIFAFSISLDAQILDPEKGPRAWKKDNVEQKSPPHLTHVREADVFWAQRIWREIDLRQKINLPLYYPANDSATLGKRSLMQIIYDEFIVNPNNAGPNSIKIYDEYELRNQDLLTADEVLQKVNPTQKTQALSKDGNVIDTTVSQPFRASDVKKFLVMEDWFIDKERSVQDVRILAFGFKYPAYKAVTSNDPITGKALFERWDKMDQSYEFWFFFPQLRPTFASIEVYNRHNDAKRLSYDDIFLKREFGSYIYKEENVYDRKINEYKKGLDALIEAERIKNDIFEYEQSIWEY